MDGSSTPGQGASVRWFAFAAAALSLASVAGAQSLSWLSAPGRVSMVASARSPSAPRTPSDPSAGIDDTPTGSIPSSALVIRLR